MTLEAETIPPKKRETPKPVPAWQRARETAFAFVRRSPKLAGGILLLLLALAGWAIWSASGTSEDDYLTAQVTRGNIENNVTALGNLQPLNFVDVGAQATGQLKVLNVDIGSEVTKGELLGEIDSQIASSKVAVSEGNLANLQAQLRDRQAQAALAQANFQRQQRLMAANATAASNYDAAEQAAQSAQAEVNAVRGQISASSSQLSGDRVTLGYTKLYAPMSGTVVSVLIKQGQTINSVQQAPTILRIADLGTMQVQTQVSEADVSKLKTGMPAYFTTLGNSGRRWTGELEQIQPTPTVTNNVVLYMATFNVNNPDRALMTQMTAQVFFVTASAKDVLTVPVSALHAARRTQTTRNGEQGERPARATRTREARPWTAGSKNAVVLVKTESGDIERRRVTVGVSSRVSAEITSGLKEGETVITGRKQATPPAQASQNRSGRMPRGMGRF